MTTGCSAVYYPPDNEVQKRQLEAVSFISHWLSLGIFTGAYIKVATQMPLFQGGQRICKYLPYILNITIVLILCGAYYAFAFVHSAAPYLAWMNFLLKVFLILTLMVI